MSGSKLVAITVTYIFSLYKQVQAHHHEDNEPWLHFHEHGIFRAFFGGFFSTLVLIFGALVFYYFCIQGGNFGRTFPMFPRKPILPFRVPFARSPQFMMDSEGQETVVLTATSPSSVFYSNAEQAPGNEPSKFPSAIVSHGSGINVPWRAPSADKSGYPHHYNL